VEVAKDDEIVVLLYHGFYSEIHCLKFKMMLPLRVNQDELFNWNFVRL